jgi:serine/threonine protein kinase
MSENLCPHCGQSHRQGARFCTTTGKLIPEIPVPQCPVSTPGVGAPLAAIPVPQESQVGLTGRLSSNAYLHERYIILRKIGQGGMAAVYQASDTLQHGAWAIKEMSDVALTNAQDRNYAIQSFQQEANLLRALSHPNLPKVIDAFTEGGKHYLVMEFVPGNTLQCMLESRMQPFTEAEVLPWALQLCDVLSYLHNQNPKIIFRDLKPSNIMLTPQGQIKLIDFGIVRFFKPWKTKDTVALGTPGYAAPEAAGGQTDERSDLYSLCVTLHQLLTLNDPLKTMFGMPPARQLNPQVSVELERILASGLQNRRELRWQSVSEMRAELARYKMSLVTGQYPIPGYSPTQQAMVAPVAGTVRAGYTPEQGRSAPAAQMGYVPTRAAPLPLTPDVSGPAPLHTSRPTTRLLMAAARLSGRQLALLATAVIVLLVAGAWFLAPALAETGINWNYVPITAIFGALGYAAYPKRGVAFASHVLLTSALTATVWMRLGIPPGYSLGGMILGVLIGGAFMEVWVSFLPKVKGGQDSEGWGREAGWLAIMEVISTIIFYGLTTRWISGLNPIQWIMSAFLGIAGWFMGDFLQQYMLYKQTGLRRLN